MTEPRWRLYPTGAGLIARGIGSALLSIPLVAALLILPFLAVRHVARLGAFGVGEAGQLWTAWADHALGLSVLLFGLCPLLVALVHLVRTMLELGALRRAVRRGAPATAVPHPDQWEDACEWSGGSLVISGLLATAVLAFPGMLTTPVRTWVETWPITQDWRMTGIPVIAIALASIFQRSRKRAMAEIEHRWPESARKAPEAAAKDWVSQPVLDSDGDPADPTQLHRTPLDRVGDQMNTAGIVLTGFAVLAAVITFIAAGVQFGPGGAVTDGERFMLLSSPLLLLAAIVLYIVGAVLQNIAQTGEQRSLFAAARTPTAAPPAVGVLARNWSTANPLWSNFIGLVGALVLLVALPARSVAGTAAQTWGSTGVAAAAMMLVLGAVLDITAGHRTREVRNFVLRRWPILKPSEMATWSTELVTQGAAGSGQSYAAMADATLEPGQRGYGGPAPVAPEGERTPPDRGDPPAAGTAVPPPPAGTAVPPAPAPEQAPPPPNTARTRRGWGLPKKLRGRGLGDLYR